MVGGMLRIASLTRFGSSVGDTTEELLNILWIKSRPPRGSYGPLDLVIVKTEGNPHGSRWGHLTFSGDAFSCDGGEDVLAWWFRLVEMIAAEHREHNSFVGAETGAIAITPPGAPEITASLWNAAKRPRVAGG